MDQVSEDGFERQRKAIARFARARGFEIVAEFKDGAVSGENDLADRPALLDALSRIAGNGVRVVIVEDVQRLARSLFVQESIIRQFIAIDARLLTATAEDLTDNSDPDRVMVRQILGSVAQNDKNRLVLKLKVARTRKRAAQGFCEGRRPYGYLSTAEADTLATMRELRRKLHRGARGASYADVAATLNAEGRLNREGRPWSASRVHAVLKQAATVDARKSRAS